MHKKDSRIENKEADVVGSREKCKEDYLRGN